MHSWLKDSLLALVALGMCWSAAIWYWRTSGRQPATGELALGLLALPALVQAGVWMVPRLRARPADARAPAPSASIPPAAPGLALVAAAVSTAHGSSPGTLAAAIASRRARPEIDRELVNERGLPVMAVRAAIDAQVAQLRARLHAPFAPDQWRALAMATDVATDLATSLRAHAPPLPVLDLVLWFPPHWSEPQRAAATAWLRQTIARAGWPAERIRPGAHTLADLARGADTVALVLAFESMLDQARVDQLELDGELFDAERPQGLMPGEGAAGVLLCCAARAHQFDAAQVPVMHVGAAGQDARALLAASGTAPARVALLVADTSHRSSRVSELMKFAHEALPHLDLGDAVLTTGAACGRAGAVPFLAALALARHASAAGTAPVVYLAQEDPTQPQALLINPTVLPSDPPVHS